MASLRDDPEFWEIIFAPGSFTAKQVNVLRRNANRIQTVMETAKLHYPNMKFEVLPIEDLDLTVLIEDDDWLDGEELFEDES